MPTSAIPLSSRFDATRYLSDEYADQIRARIESPPRVRRTSWTRSSTRIRSISASSTATATPSPSSIRCSQISVAASWRRRAASCFIAAARSSASRRVIRTPSGRQAAAAHHHSRLLVKDGRAVMPFGVMGGHYQATGHAHFLARLLTGGFDPQAAAEAPRSFAFGGILHLEPTIDSEHRRRPRANGSRNRLDDDNRSAAARRSGSMPQRGVLIGGSDPRKDGMASGIRGRARSAHCIKQVRRRRYDAVSAAQASRG